MCQSKTLRKKHLTKKLLEPATGIHPCTMLQDDGRPSSSPWQLGHSSESRDLKLRIDALGTILGKWEEPSKTWHTSQWEDSTYNPIFSSKNLTCQG
jgi:hypothetical protein